MSNTVARPIKNGIKQQVAAGNLDPQEWDFSNVPQKETEACYLYESAREFFKKSQHLQKLRNRWCSHQKGKGVEGYLAWGQALDLLRTRCKNFPDVNFKYFPEVAWQDLPDLARSRAAEYVNYRGAQARKQPSDRLHIETLRQCEPANIRSLEAFQDYHDYFHPVQDEDQTEYGFFAVNWGFKSSQIVEAFKHWLNDQGEVRRTSGLKEAKPEPSRGQFRDKLNWLCALRLKNHYRKKELVDYNDARLKIAGAPYSHYPDLLDAAKKAKQEIARLFSRDWDESAWRQKQKQQPKIKAQLPEFLK